MNCELIEMEKPKIPPVSTTIKKKLKKANFPRIGWSIGFNSLWNFKPTKPKNTHELYHYDSMK